MSTTAPAARPQDRTPQDQPPNHIDPEVLAAESRRWTPARIAVWIGVGLLGGLGWVMLALVRGETVNGIWFVFAAVCSYLIAYRFWSTYIQDKLVRPDDRRATPAEAQEDGRDYMPTDRRVLYGHHFAAIAGAGPPRDSRALWVASSSSSRKATTAEDGACCQRDSNTARGVVPGP